MSNATLPPGRPGPQATAVSAPFWEAAADGRLLLQRCEDCRGWQHYPRTLCAACWSPRLAWAEPRPTGRVWTFTIAHRPGHSAWEDAVPYAIAIVELDDGPRLLTNIVGCPPDAVRVGMAVAATFEPRDGYSVVQFTPRAPDARQEEEQS